MQRESFRHSGALVDGAKLIDLVLADLDAVDEADAMRVVTLRDASRRSGYSAEHLARLVRQGIIPNAGRKGVPRIRVSDLPMRREFARNRAGSYDVNADARTLKNGRQ
jgi:hypothetical protein